MNAITDFLSSFEDAQSLLNEERLIVSVTEAIAAEMTKKGVTKAALAQELGCTKAYVSQLLGGTRNMTLRTLATIARALGMQPEFRLSTLGSDDDWKTGPKPIGKVVRLHREKRLPNDAANDDSGWSPLLRVVNG